MLHFLASKKTLHPFLLFGADSVIMSELSGRHVGKLVLADCYGVAVHTCVGIVCCHNPVHLELRQHVPRFIQSVLVYRSCCNSVALLQQC